jgi:hypothetical protein
MPCPFKSVKSALVLMDIFCFSHGWTKIGLLTLGFQKSLFVISIWFKENKRPTTILLTMTLAYRSTSLLCYLFYVARPETAFSVDDDRVFLDGDLLLQRQAGGLQLVLILLAVGQLKHSSFKFNILFNFYIYVHDYNTTCCEHGLKGKRIG